MVRDNNIDQALRVLKKKMQREGVFREMKRRRFYEKPSERSAREHDESLRRARKLARKRAQREGLLPAPRSKKLVAGKPTERGGALSGTARPPRQTSRSVSTGSPTRVSAGVGARQQLEQA
jgi:small subunit ribosomal protein S21